MTRVQDTDFNALLQDIAAGPASLGDLAGNQGGDLDGTAPDEAQASRPGSEEEKDNMADSASEDVAAASVSAERKSFRQRFNPMRGFLSRRPSSVSLFAWPFPFPFSMHTRLTNLLMHVRPLESSEYET